MERERNERARQIFMEIIDLPEDQQHTQLDELCGDDTPLKLEVDALLLAHEEAKDFMASPTVSAHSAPITEKPGTVIGNYKLLQQIGEGGFGTVFLADQSKPIRRRVALKIIKLGMDTKQVIARFEAERQAIALMDHPNIARVLDAGATDSGRPFFVMEYVVGDSITKFADAHKLSVRDRLKLFSQACLAVQHAHTKGIIHRDIKPSNILVSMTDGRPFAKVIDFGIAKATATPLTEKTLFTEHHQLIGTLEYMSPEQAEGLPDIDTRTDVYALGVLLYELLTGQTPLDGKRLRSAAWNEMRRIIKEEEPPAPSLRLSRDVQKLAEIATDRQAEPTKLSSILRGELDWIAIKALDKDRARRYETPSALAADVQRHLDGDAVVAAPVSRGYKLRKFVRRNRGVVVAGSAVAATLLVGIATTTWQWNEAYEANTQLADNIEIARGSLIDIIVETVDLDPMERSTVMVEMGVTEDEARREQAAAYVDGMRAGLVASAENRGEANSLAERSDIGLLALEAGSAVKRASRLQIELQEKTDTAEWSSYTANLALAQMAMDNGNWPEARDRVAACPESKHGWEWEFLSNMAESVVREFAGYGGRYSPNNQAVITELDNSRVHVWKTSGDQVSKFQTPEMFSSTRFSPDGRFILVLHEGLKSISLWTINGKPYGDPFYLEGEFNDNYIRSAAFRDDSRSLLLQLNGMVLTYDINTGDARKIGENMSAALGRLGSDSPTGYLVLSDYRGDVHFMQVFDSHGEPVGNPIPQDFRTLFSSFRHDGEQFVSISEGHTARIWDINGSAIGKPMHHQEIVRDTLFNPDGSVIITVDDLDTVRFWDAKGQLLGAQIVHQKWNGPPLYSPDGQHLITSTNGQLHLWDNDRNLLSIVENPGRSAMFDGPDAQAIAFTDDGQSVLYSYGNYAEGSAERIRILPIPWISAVRSVDAKDHVYGTPISYALAHLRISAELYDGFNSGPPPSHMAYWFDEDRTAIAAHPDGSRIVTAAADNTVRFWDPETQKELASIPMDAGVTNLTFTPDGTRLVIELDDGSARVFDTRSAEDQAADVQRRWAERIPAGEYLDTLMAGPTPTDDLMAVIEIAPSLTPLRRLAAAELLLERLSDIEARSSREFAALSKDQTDLAVVLAAATSTDLPVRVKEQVLAKAQVWEYKPPKPTAQQRLAEESRKRERAENALQNRSYAYFIQEAYSNWERAYFETARGILDKCPEDLREFEWHALQEKCSIWREPFTAHQSPISALAFSSISGVMASAGEDHSIKIWDCKSRPPVLLNSVEVPESAARTLHFTPDGETILSVGDGAGVVVRDSETLEIVRVLGIDNGILESMTLDPRGSWCAAGTVDGKILIWNLETGTLLHELRGHESPVTALLSSPFRDLLVSGDESGWLMMWNPVRGDRLEDAVVRLGGDEPYVISALGFDDDGNVIAGPRSGSSTPPIEISIELPKIHERSVIAYANDDLGVVDALRRLSRGYTHIGAGGRLDPGRSWEEPIPAKPSRSRGVAVSHDGRWGATGRDDGSVLISKGWHNFVPSVDQLVWDSVPIDPETLVRAYVGGDQMFLLGTGGLLSIPLAPRTREATIYPINQRVLEIKSVSASGRWVLLRMEDEQTRLLDSNTEELVAGWDLPGQLMFGPSEGWFVQATDSEIIIRSVPSGEVQRTIPLSLQEGSELTKLSISPDGSKIGYATLSRSPDRTTYRFNGIKGGEVGVIDLKSGKQLWEVGEFPTTMIGSMGMKDPIGNITFDPMSSKLLVTARGLTMFDVPSGELLESAATSPVERTCFSPDGTRFFTSQPATAWGRQDKVSMWDSQYLTRLAEWDVEYAWELFMAPSGTELVVLGATNLSTIPIWDVRGVSAIHSAIAPVRLATEIAELLKNEPDRLNERLTEIDESKSLTDKQKAWIRTIVGIGNDAADGER